LFCIGLALLEPSRLFSAPKKLKVVTTFLPAYCFAANVAGDAADVENLLPPNVSPHEYQLSSRDMTKLSEADLVVMNGLGIEHRMSKALRSAGVTNAKTVVLSQGMEKELIPGAGSPDHESGRQGHFHEEGASNPHLWLDPALAMQAVQTVARAFAKADPANASAYQENARSYAQRLEKLNQEIAKTLQPVQRIPFITFHNAFAYFARRYQLQIPAVVEEQPDVPPSARKVASLLRLIRKAKIKAIFTEPQSSPKLARMLARDSGIALASLNTLETGEINPNAYEEGLRQNAHTLLSTLQ
jgi:zinc/manganese transport system substrate-binding protein